MNVSKIFHTLILSSLFYFLNVIFQVLILSVSRLVLTVNPAYIISTFPSLDPNCLHTNLSPHFLSYLLMSLSLCLSRGVIEICSTETVLADQDAHLR